MDEGDSTEMAKITIRGQITVPATVRKKLNLRTGDKIVFMESGKGYRLLNERDVENGNVR